MQLIRAIIFDFDDTLVATRQAKFRQARAVAKKYFGRDLTDEYLAAHYGKPMDKYLQSIYGQDSPIEELYARHLSLASEFPLEPYDDTITTLQELAARGILLGILTSDSRKIFQFDTARALFPCDLFSIVQCADDTAAHKPDPEVFKPIASFFQRRSVPQKQTIYVGDSISDYLAATGAGIRFIGIARCTAAKEQFNVDGGCQTIGRLSQLLALPELQTQ